MLIRPDITIIWILSFLWMIEFPDSHTRPPYFWIEYKIILETNTDQSPHPREKTNSVEHKFIIDIINM